VLAAIITDADTQELFRPYMKAAKMMSWVSQASSVYVDLVLDCISRARVMHIEHLHTLNPKPFCLTVYLYMLFIGMKYAVWYLEL
jgi:hypothetical protein